MEMIEQGKTQVTAAAIAGFDVKTGRKYSMQKTIPSSKRKRRSWRTRKDPFIAIWPEACEFLAEECRLEGRVLFEYFQKKYPGKFEDNQLRTFQRKLKIWRAENGPAKEVFFTQDHFPGKLCASDFTHMTELGITIGGKLFKHLVYHFVLTYSNWETGYICQSESFQSLSNGLQSALWELGGVPESHRTDRLSAAVINLGNRDEFTRAYESLLSHYKLCGVKIQAAKANQNGDVEQSHNRFKKAVDQALMLRGYRDFSSEHEYNCFLRDIFLKRNSSRQIKFSEEKKELRALPVRRLDDFKLLKVNHGSR